MGTWHSRSVALDRRFRELRVLPYLMLGISLLLYALSQRPAAGPFEITAGIAGLAAAWNAWMLTQRPDPVRRPWTARAYIAGMIAFAVALALRSPWFGFFTYLLFPGAARYLAGAWRWAALVAASVAFSISQVGGFQPFTIGRAGYLALVVCLDVAITGTLSVRMEQKLSRARMSAELADANRRREEILAENAGLQAQLLTQAREAGVLEERQRMAREIHDTLAQGLTGIITQLEVAQRTGQDDERERRIGNAKQLARDSLAEARRSVQALRPQALEEARLPDALATETARWSATSGIKAEVTTTGDARPLHPEVEVTLLRVAQEALANVAKHAGASHAGVTLSYMEDVVTLDVRDDGSGFRPNGTPLPEGGFGLTTMRQRVTRLAGHLEIESEPGGGTAVSASVPAIPSGGPA
ncbi:MAG TPA: histidine kinase [Streptosporangiaceae bacterium]